jgi:hypothetical protein
MDVRARRSEIVGLLQENGKLETAELRASANRPATFHTWQLSEGFNSLPTVP